MNIYTQLTIDAEDRRTNHQEPPTVFLTVDAIIAVLKADLLGATADEEDMMIRDEMNEVYNRVINGLTFDKTTSHEFDMPPLEEYWIFTKHEV